MNSGIELLWANNAELNMDHQIQEHSHICYQMYYILEGDPVFFIRGKEVPAHTSSFFYIPPNTPHRMLPLSRKASPLEVKFFVYDEALRSLLPTEPIVLEDDILAKRMFLYVVHNWRSKDPQNIATIEHILYSLLSCFFLDQVQYDNQDSSLIDTDRYSHISRMIMAYIENHFHAPFSMQKMAEQLNYHRNYLSTVFSKDTGISIVDYLNLVRIRQAVIFFAYYNQDAFTTYESIGFTNGSHFSRVFKTLAGVSPRNFKYAFSAVNRQTVSQHFTDEPILNYRTCSLTEAFSSLKNIGAAANQILLERKNAKAPS